MARTRYRACLQEGLMLDLNKLIRQSLVGPNASWGPNFIRWSYTYTDEAVASGWLTGGRASENSGWMQVQLGTLHQQITLVRRPRHFGGGQWYFVCPYSGRTCSVLWMPPGGRHFACRQAWGGQVAYSSQFRTAHDRAITAAQRLRYRLGGIDYVSLLDGGDPPKPKWMRWKTYEQILARSHHYEAVADERLSFFLNRFAKFV